MNILGAFFLAQTQDRFEFFQIVFSFLNLLVFIPSCLLLPAISGVRRTRILPLVVLLALNPVVMQNATYSWTKSLTAFYIILGIAFYLSACRKSDTLRMVIAFVSLAAAILVHYSAGPYVVVITAHYLLTVFWKRRQRWKEFALISATCTAVLATYFGWAFTVYGEATIRSASNVTPGQHDQGNYVVNIPANLLDTIVPSVLGQRSMMMDSIKQSNSIGWLRDFAFSFYQPNMLFSMGLIGGPAVLWLLFRRFRRRPAKRSEGWTFWLAFVPFTVLVAMLIVGDRERLGMAHGVFLSLEIIGLTLLANAIGRRRTLAGLVLAGSLFDFSLGIFLHAHVQSLENGAGKTFFGDLVYANGMLRHAGPTADTLSDTAWQNWFGKHRLALCDRWLKELPERYATEKPFQIFWPSYRAQISDLRKEDGQWGGWYSRHDGEILYFGDHVAGTVGERVPLFVLVLLTAGLITLYIQQTPAAVQVRRKSQVRTKSRSS